VTNVAAIEVAVLVVELLAGLRTATSCASSQVGGVEYKTGFGDLDVAAPKTTVEGCFARSKVAFPAHDVTPGEYYKPL